MAAKKTGEAAAVPSRRPLTVNICIDGVWYGPAWGNADAYPDEGHDGRDELFTAPDVTGNPVDG